MPDKQIFIPEKLSIISFKLIKGQVEAPEEFIVENVEGHHLENNLELGFNLQDKLIKVDYTIDITTESKGKNKNEAKGSFHFVFIFSVENLEELAILNEKKMIDLNGSLGNALSGITYSTSRGILLTRLQGTPFQNFILPVINPNNLLAKGNKNK